MDLNALLEQFSNGEVDKQKVVDAIEEQNSGMVPRSRLNDKNTEIKDLKEELTNRDKQIETLEKSVKQDSELQNELEQLKQTNADWQTKYQESQLNNAIKLGVAKDANDPNDILAFINKDGLEVQEDGEVKGLDDALSNLRESKPYLFAETKPTGRKPEDGSNPTGGLTSEQFNSMSFDDKQNLYQNDPDTFNKLIGG
ncbi:phage scaffolding protein [Staphylococcus succinus]|uniref:phage scaffolding protein n=1 Tax=Staphylococcus succinus TaxID=61015 RepID=UPI002480B738|nr:phage scaffolding protein [Staphylococcus succinus]MDH9161295.1 phage scaffolding protein [Staphylococcus succinus]